ncbi:integrase family protein [Thermoanaerobacterium thermosaccharolyticum]|uniref:Integrase family protein n=3 Tax=Thermoanaerobacterium TaxID=28895 RepID=A0A231V864_THETR|nr:MULTISPECIES: tyrosine-type recombinase/integrase [Thermoanaerobacterium]AGB18844.1 site-specific recombinase XerD [Thermoanaerobacterium thermosaccharolyticum M0795]AST56266.1 integrase family protein-Site-specific recombinase XerD [Thermoanaerobacterium thermosaccharolyticum]AST59214.1 integrase family protein [Thermoanaerobacterium thermosaccharolyticum]MBP2073306.1 integrase [Thermoanaerobacterium butyriciformans]OXT04367.1 recombinase XerD [Thermoanaerobacterium thermosaccharolyticum]
MTVEPIRDKNKIKQMYQYLNGYNPKYALLFKFGINTGLRISDIISLRVKDIFNSNGQFREYLVLKEKKTSKEKKIKLNTTLRKAIISYVSSQNLSDDSYLFFSQKGGHLSRVQVYRVLKEAANIIGIENFGTHSLRKTWGYWTYQMSKYNIGLIMDTFNHSSQSITLRYIGINQDQKDELYSTVQL